MQTPPLRSVHLDIKDEQCDKKMMGVKFHIKSYRVWALRASKRSVLGTQEFKFLQKFEGKIGIDLTLIFCINDFFVRFLVTNKEVKLQINPIAILHLAY